MRVSRRDILGAGAAATGLAALSPSVAATKARYTRYNVTSPQGQAMLKSYALAISRMLDLSPTHPHNWFRNAFVHFMDCPHGNWWFYVWHRGYVGFFEQTVRQLSGNPNFAFPYWDWTELPQIPDAMFDGPLTPTDKQYLRYTQDLPTFTRVMRPSLEAYWNSLNAQQRQQQSLRGWNNFNDLWQNMLGYDSKGVYSAGDQAFAPTDRARFLTRANPKLAPKTAANCTPDVIKSGLSPVLFNSPDVPHSFTSVKVPNHNAMPAGRASFSVLEGQPHNLIHNNIGGAFDGPGSWGDGPFGNMTNNLSPVDPIFFLHHSNMDRLWDLWTRKQQRLGLPTLPTDKAELAQFVDEPFLFFVRPDGSYVLNGKAGDYLNMERFQYDYGPAVSAPALVASATPRATPPAAVLGTVTNGTGTLALSAAAAATPVTLAITMTRPVGPNAPKQFDILVNAPPGVTEVSEDSPYYGGTIGFFGPPMHGMSHQTTFAVPLRRSPATGALGATATPAPLEIRLAAPAGSPAPAVEAVSAQSQ